MATTPTKSAHDERATVTFIVTTEADGLSDIADLTGFGIVALEGSTAWTAAGVELLGSNRSSANMRPISNGGTTGSTSRHRLSSDSIPTATSHIFPMPERSSDGTFVGRDVFTGMRFMQLFSGSTASTAVVQQAARTWFGYLVPAAIRRY